MLFYLAAIESDEDKRKFEKLYNDYKQIMYYAAYRILKNQYNSEDAVHLAFLRVLENMDKIDENNYYKTKAFLVVIVEHISIDIYRKQKRENLLPVEEMQVYLSDNHDTRQYDEIIFAIASLPLNYSTVLRLKYSLDFSNEEIAKILHISEDNVRQRLARAKKKLRKLLN